MEYDYNYFNNQVEFYSDYQNEPIYNQKNFHMKKSSSGPNIFENIHINYNIVNNYSPIKHHYNYGNNSPIKHHYNYKNNNYPFIKHHYNYGNNSPLKHHYNYENNSPLKLHYNYENNSPL